MNNRLLTILLVILVLAALGLIPHFGLALGGGALGTILITILILYIMGVL